MLVAALDGKRLATNSILEVVYGIPPGSGSVADGEKCATPRTYRGPPGTPSARPGRSATGARRTGPGSGPRARSPRGYLGDPSRRAPDRLRDLRGADLGCRTTRIEAEHPAVLHVRAAGPGSCREFGDMRMMEHPPGARSASGVACMKAGGVSPPTIRYATWWCWAPSLPRPLNDQITSLHPCRGREDPRPVPAQPRTIITPGAVRSPA